MAEYVVVDKEQLETDLTAVADAIRTKSGKSGTLAFPNGFVEAAESITPRTEADLLNESIRNNTLEAFSDENMTSIPDAFFAGCSSLYTVDIPNATSIGMGAFAFLGYWYFEFGSMNLRSVTEIGMYAFCQSLIPSTLEIGFESDDTDTLNFPNLKTIGLYAFYGSFLTELLCDTDDGYITIQQGAFDSSTLRKAIFNCSVDIKKHAFLNCRSFDYIELNWTIYLENTNAFMGTPFENGEGEFRILESLKNWYADSPTWSVVIHDWGNTVTYV